MSRPTPTVRADRPFLYGAQAIRANSIRWDSARPHPTGTRRSFAFDSGEHDGVLDFEDNGRIVVGEPPFRLSMSHAVPRDGISLFTGGGSSPSGYTIAPSGEMPSRNLLVGCLLGGAGSLLAEGNERLDWRAPGQMYLVSLSERTLNYDIFSQADYSAVTMMLTPEALELVASEDGLPELLVDVLEGRSEPVAFTRPLPLEARRTAQELMSPPYQGRAGELYQEAKTLELLAHQTGILMDAPPQRRELSTRELIRVREARERLLANLREPPGLAELAAAVSLTPKRLNFGFRQLFGMTVFHYLMESRLLLARKMLEDGLDIPLKQLAWSVGYNQVSNFITAFRRRFGVSPGLYRRHAEQDQ